ncbi:hypothetical protein FPL14_18825 [Cohnella cholangitidis]|uniref:Uncharacterized protein n=1 Tax=Cohnella cholangitidis TaxID=2598458 RepID=A0A7G5C1C2_9BACL|nr:hypothetical protein FPL14_18825 [Cohnella cholangitidis]
MPITKSQLTASFLRSERPFRSIRQPHNLSLLKREFGRFLINTAIQLSHYLQQRLPALKRTLFNSVQRVTIDTPVVMHKLIMSVQFVVETAPGDILRMGAEIIHLEIDTIGRANISKIEIV